MIRKLYLISSTVGLVCAVVLGWFIGSGAKPTQMYLLMGLLAAALWFGGVIPAAIRLSAVLALNKLGFTVKRNGTWDWDAGKPGHYITGDRSPEGLYDSASRKPKAQTTSPGIVA